MRIDSGSVRPVINRNSSALSSPLVSEQSGSMTGKSDDRSSLKSSLCITPSRARIQFRLPRKVLISPLWAIMRIGCARSQLGNVLVEKRACTMAR